MENQKEITIETNFNKKLDCDVFIHIQPPWQQGINRSTQIRIITRDRSHDPVTAVVIDSVKQTFANLNATFIYLSHGIDPVEFRNTLQKKVPNIQPDTELAIYFYKKIA